MSTDSKALAHLAAPTEELIDTMRWRFITQSAPWVIENVAGAPLPRQSTLDGRHGVELCGTMFGLRVRRHRLFETSFPVHPPRGCDHRKPALNPYNADSRRRDGIERNSEAAFAEAMEIDWMRGKSGPLKSEISEAVPPAYTELIGHQLLQHVRARAVALTGPAAGDGQP